MWAGMGMSVCLGAGCVRVCAWVWRYGVLEESEGKGTKCLLPL